MNRDPTAIIVTAATIVQPIAVALCVEVNSHHVIQRNTALKMTSSRRFFLSVLRSADSRFQEKNIPAMAQTYPRSFFEFAMPLFTACPFHMSNDRPYSG